MRGLRFDAAFLSTCGGDYDMIFGAIILLILGGLAFGNFWQQGIIDELRGELEELRQKAKEQEDGRL